MLEVECKRYVTFPGQACAYKVGELKLKQLRKKAKSALGMKTLWKELKLCFHFFSSKFTRLPLKLKNLPSNGYNLQLASTLNKSKNIEGLIETKNSATSLFLKLINILFAGDKFDIKDFHDVVLQCGAVPLKFLEYEVNEYIKEELETLMTLESLEDWTFYLSLFRPHPQTANKKLHLAHPLWAVKNHNASVA